MSSRSDGPLATRPAKAVVSFLETSTLACTWLRSTVTTQPIFPSPQLEHKRLGSKNDAEDAHVPSEFHRRLPAIYVPRMNPRSITRNCNHSSSAGRLNDLVQSSTRPYRAIHLDQHVASSRAFLSCHPHVAGRGDVPYNPPQQSLVSEEDSFPNKNKQESPSHPSGQDNRRPPVHHLLRPSEKE